MEPPRQLAFRDGAGAGSAAAASAAGSVSGSAVASHTSSLALFMEYSNAIACNLGGLYLLPSEDDQRLWYGVQFIRQSFYGGGVFKFRVVLPQQYPADGALPRVCFDTPVYHPLVHAEVSDEAIPRRGLTVLVTGLAAVAALGPCVCPHARARAHAHAQARRCGFPAHASHPPPLQH
jgi:hypothetical protein